MAVDREGMTEPDEPHSTLQAGQVGDGKHIMNVVIQRATNTADYQLAKPWEPFPTTPRAWTNIKSKE